jgi:hypothetical protein
MYTALLASIGGSISCVALAGFGLSAPVAGGFFIAMVFVGAAIDAMRAKPAVTKVAAK